MTKTKRTKLIVALLALLPGMVGAQQRDKSRSQRAELVATADRLVLYGYGTQTALPLLQALQLYDAVGLSDEPLQLPMRTDAAGQAHLGARTDAAVDFTRAGLRAAAQRFAAGDKALQALIAQQGTTRTGQEGNNLGRVEGTVFGTSTNTYDVMFAAGEECCVVLTGYNTSNLHLYVYDPHDRVVAADMDLTPSCVVHFVAPITGYYSVMVRNLGDTPNSYVLTTTRNRAKR